MDIQEYKNYLKEKALKDFHLQVTDFMIDISLIPNVELAIETFISLYILQYVNTRKCKEKYQFYYDNVMLCFDNLDFITFFEEKQLQNMKKYFTTISERINPKVYKYRKEEFDKKLEVFFKLCISNKTFILANIEEFETILKEKVNLDNKYILPETYQQPLCPITIKELESNVHNVYVKHKRGNNTTEYMRQYMRNRYKENPTDEVNNRNTKNIKKRFNVPQELQDKYNDYLYNIIILKKYIDLTPKPILDKFLNEHETYDFSFLNERIDK